MATRPGRPRGVDRPRRTHSLNQRLTRSSRRSEPLGRSSSKAPAGIDGAGRRGSRTPAPPSKSSRQPGGSGNRRPDWGRSADRSAIAPRACCSSRLAARRARFLVVCFAMAHSDGEVVDTSTVSRVSLRTVNGRSRGRPKGPSEAREEPPHADAFTCASDA